jgi:hypothetical protein
VTKSLSDWDKRSCSSLIPPPRLLAASAYKFLRAQFEASTKSCGGLRRNVRTVSKGTNPLYSLLYDAPHKNELKLYQINSDIISIHFSEVHHTKLIGIISN